jgi:hypothetical protein
MIPWGVEKVPFLDFPSFAVIVNSKFLSAMVENPVNSFIYFDETHGLITLRVLICRLYYGA